MTDGNTCTCRGYAAMHKPHPHADRDGSEARAQLEREHERALAAYVPEDIDDSDICEYCDERHAGRCEVGDLLDELAARFDVICALTERAEKAEADVEMWRARYEVADGEAKAAEVALARVEALHAAHGGSTDGGKTWAHECLGGCGEWPCMTALAIYPDAEQKLNDRLRAAFADPDVEDAS